MQSPVVDALSAQAIQYLPFVFALLAALLLAWVRARILAVEATAVATQVELEAQLDPELKGPAKLARAQVLLAERLKSYGALTTFNASALLERSLPAARKAAEESPLSTKAVEHTKD